MTKEYSCEFCHKLFKRRGRRVPRFCSFNCRSTSTSRKRWANHISTVTFQCDWCGKIKTQAKRHYELNAHHFCSRKCTNDSGMTPGFVGYKIKDKRRTDIEVIVEQYLKDNKLEYEFEKKFGKYYADFVVGNFVIECDGEYWHSRPEDIKSDSRKNEFLVSKGYTVIRLAGKGIKSGAFKDTLASILLAA